MKPQKYPILKATLAIFCLVVFPALLLGTSLRGKTSSAGAYYPYKGDIAALRNLDALSVMVYVITFGQAAHYAQDQQHLLPNKLRVSSQKSLQQQVEHALDEAGILAYGPNDSRVGGYNDEDIGLGALAGARGPVTSGIVPTTGSLWVNVEVVAVPGDVHLYAVNVQTELRQLVVLKRDQTVHLTARTWPKYGWHYTHIAGPKELEKTMRDVVAYQVRSFINDYIAASIMAPDDHLSPGAVPDHIRSPSRPKDNPEQ